MRVAAGSPQELELGRVAPLNSSILKSQEVSELDFENKEVLKLES